MTEEKTPPAQPILKVVSGNPTEEEVATLTVLFASMAANAQAPERDRDRNLWGNIEERLRRPATFNPTAFQNVSFY